MRANILEPPSRFELETGVLQNRCTDHSCCRGENRSHIERTVGESSAPKSFLGARISRQNKRPPCSLLIHSSIFVHHSAEPLPSCTFAVPYSANFFGFLSPRDGRRVTCSTTGKPVIRAQKRRACLIFTSACAKTLTYKCALKGRYVRHQRAQQRNSSGSLFEMVKHFWVLPPSPQYSPIPRRNSGSDLCSSQKLLASRRHCIVLFNARSREPLAW